MNMDNGMHQFKSTLAAVKKAKFRLKNIQKRHFHGRTLTVLDWRDELDDEVGENDVAPRKFTETFALLDNFSPIPSLFTSF
ncbi:hypothetical protein CCR75_004026 [Bremia lactucae]|uniref:Uncharacterized protein n=1 Tax=Bremia lactucae TaxID=4779 RepID=A0A976IFM1_BRELC|nr:hypothetical protein CCR75_004026 [Bremia lactucae]